MDVMNIVILIGSVITAAGVIVSAVVKVIRDVMNPINKKLDCMDERQCKSFLVDFLNDIENGIEKDEVQYKLAHDIYDHYSKPESEGGLNKNSYIHDK